ncbi:MAG: hypothetical protein NXI03_03220 [Alphaproteobacteria bacterium]|uniref:hypothetical protein n=1 Tax=Maricaulis alexandrii TaxID=2570354 RepID=UPI001109D352|nr:hypothetical protein [Maricaulis alexandrii]MCR9266556.1 hypothetical protein [Alphaproteobacteria bacterium]
MLDRWARWVIAAGVAFWSFLQLQYFLHAILIFTGQHGFLDLDRSYVEVIRSLHPVEVAVSLVNPPLYLAATILIALRNPVCLPVFGLALLFDLGGWLSYSMNAAYDQTNQSNYDWLINTGLLVALMALITLRQRGHFKRSARAGTEG